nr:antimicrobial peptides-like isoform X3 [Lolium perenne]
MGSQRNGGVLWCLLLAGLLLVAVAAAEVEAGRDPREDVEWCKKDCDWKGVHVAQCKKQCHEKYGQQEDGLMEVRTEWVDLGRCKKECERMAGQQVAQCKKQCHEKYGQQEDGVFNGVKTGIADLGRCKRECDEKGGEVIECKKECHQKYGQQQEESHGGECESRCQKECQHHTHDYERKQCIRDCKEKQRGGGGSGAGGRGREGDERQHAWETVAAAILQAV